MFLMVLTLASLVGWWTSSLNSVSRWDQWGFLRCPLLLYQFSPGLCYFAPFIYFIHKWLEQPASTASYFKVHWRLSRPVPPQQWWLCLRQVVRDFTDWCESSFLKINVLKRKEIQSLYIIQVKMLMRWTSINTWEVCLTTHWPLKCMWIHFVILMRECFFIESYMVLMWILLLWEGFILVLLSFY